MDTSATELSATFLKRGGEMGALIRAHDWSTTLGPPEQWPQSLRTVVRLMLNTEHPVFIFWGPDLICLYNDAYRSFIGEDRHRVTLGARARDAWHDLWDIIAPQIELVMSGQGSTWHEDQRIPIVRRGGLEEAFWTYSYSPINEDGAPHGVGGILVICAETTQKMLVQRHYTFRLGLEELLRSHSTSAAIGATSTRMLGEFLQARRCGYGEIDLARRRLTVNSEWTDGRAQSLGPYIHLSEFGPSFMAWHRPNHALQINDPLYGSLHGAVAAAAASHGGFAAPLVKQGHLVAALYIYPGSELRWSDLHLALIRDVAERTFEAISLAQSSGKLEHTIKALRASEARYRLLVEASAAIVWEMHDSGEFTQEQPGWSTYTGQTLHELQGLGWLNAVHPDDQDIATEALGRALETRSSYELRYRLRRHDGVFRPMRVRAVPVVDDTGTLRGWTGIHTELPE